MAAKPDYLQEAWGVLRPVYLSQGLDTLVHEADVLSADEAKQLSAPTTFEGEWNDVQGRLRKASKAKLDVDGEMVAAPLLEWAAYAKKSTQDRLAHLGDQLRTSRGILYTGFLLGAQVRTKDWHLKSVIAMRPDITTVIGAEVRDGIESPLVEQRVRQLAAAVMRVMESYYKPLVSILWTLTARVTGYGKAMPTMCGRLMGDCSKLWGTLSDFIVPTDFLDWDALQVRNGIAHSAKTRFDTKSLDLVFEDHGTEVRINEEELRRRLHGILYRCFVMDAALLWVAGELPVKLSAEPKNRLSTSD